MCAHSHTTDHQHHLSPTKNKTKNTSLGGPQTSPNSPGRTQCPGTSFYTFAAAPSQLYCNNGASYTNAALAPVQQDFTSVASYPGLASVPAESALFGVGRNGKLYGSKNNGGSW